MHCKKTGVAAFSIEKVTVCKSFVFIIHLNNKFILTFITLFQICIKKKLSKTSFDSKCLFLVKSFDPDFIPFEIFYYLQLAKEKLIIE